jgi:predicted O-methyltransferase YrrM
MNMAINNLNSVTGFIEDVVHYVPGWTPPDQLLALYLLALSTEPLGGDIAEIGSWCGRSCAVLGRAAQDSRNTKVCAVDLFPAKSDWFQNADGSYSFKVTLSSGATLGGYEDQTVWKEPFERDIAPLYERHTSILEVFEATMARYNLNNVVTARRGGSSLFEGSGLKVRLAFIDGDHSYRAVCDDISSIEKVLLPGGWLCFDDAFTSYAGVDRALEEKILRSDNYDCLQQVSRKMFVARRRPY